jgi:hypothetical protein
MISKTPLLDEVLSDFDSLHWQLDIKQKNDEVKRKKQKNFNIEQFVYEKEAKKSSMFYFPPSRK